MFWHERTLHIDRISQRLNWLSSGERDALLGSRAQGGRLAARLVAKQLLAEFATPIDHFSQIHIESRDGRNRATRPQAYVHGRLIPWNLSLSHTERTVSAAILPAHHGNIGVDLVDLTSLSSGPLEYWFTLGEAERATDPLSKGIIWSLKEAIYKATNEGTPFFPSSINTPKFLSCAEWSRVDRELRTQGEATAMMNNDWELSLNFVDGTIKTLVWCPAPQCELQTPV